MKIWIDDMRPAPEGYVWCKSVQEAKDTVLMLELYATVNESYKVELIDIDHDAGGDYIKVLDWFEETERNYPIRIHSISPKSELEICAHYSAD